MFITGKIALMLISLNCFLMHLSSAIPWGGTPGKFNVEWGLIRGFERLTYPGGGGNEGGLFSKSLAPRGKQGTLQTKQVNFKLS